MLEKLGVELVKLDLPFRLNHVNCFLAENDDGLLIIDTGLNVAHSRKVWDEIIDNRHVAKIYITHYHPDHYGYAGGLQEKTGADVVMTKIDNNAGKNAWTDEYIQSIRDHYTISSVPDKLADLMTANNEDFQKAITPYPQVSRFFQEGEQVQIGKDEYEVIFTPGHSDGLVCFYNKSKDVLFSTDHILPRITPNISYWFHGNENPLKTYFTSLKKIKKLNVNYVIPSHGKPFENANKRITEIIAHHDERLNETLQYIKETSTVYEVCEKLFPMELTVHEMRFAIGETMAHLEYLRYEGECVRQEENGRWYYTRL